MTRNTPFKPQATKSKSGRGSLASTDPVLMAHNGLDEVRDSGAARLTITAFTAFVIFALVWAGQVEVEEKVGGSGTIEPQGRIERIEHPDGGLVRELVTRENAVLPAGGVLLHFDTDHIEREANAIAVRISTLEDEGERVQFLLHADGRTMPVQRGNGDPASEAFWTEQVFFIAQLERIDAEDARLKAQVENTEARREISRAEKEVVAEQLSRYERFSNSGAISLMDRERIKREFLQLNGVIEEVEGRRIELQSARAENARRRDELLAQRRRDAAARWTKIEEELVTLRESAADASARIKRAEVRSVNGGEVHRLEVQNPNEVVAPGDVIAEIVPPGTAYRAVINVSADRIGSIRQGMDVSLKIVSYDFTRFGAISAQISEVSPTSFVNDTGDVVYRVSVDLPETISTDNTAINIRPGMTVSGDILTGERSILSYLLKPVRNVQDQSLSEI